MAVGTAALDNFYFGKMFLLGPLPTDNFELTLLLLGRFGPRFFGSSQSRDARGVQLRQPALPPHLPRRTRASLVARALLSPA